MNDNSFGSSKAAKRLAATLSTETNKHIKSYVGSTITEYGNFINNIQFVKEKELSLGRKFALYYLQEKLLNVKNSKNLSQKLKDLTSNILIAKYRNFGEFKKNK